MMSRVFYFAAAAVSGMAVMKRVRIVCLMAMTGAMIVLSNVTVDAETINLRGKVSDSAGVPIANAIVTVVNKGLKDTTGADGIYAINGTHVMPPIKSLLQSRKIVLENGSLIFSLPEPSTVKVEFFTIEGKLLEREVLPNASSGFHRFSIDKKFHTNLLMIRTSIGRDESTFRYVRSNGRYLVNRSSNENSASIGGKLAKITAIIDTLKISADKYMTKKIPITSYDQQLDVSLDTSLINGNILLSEGFEGTNLDSAGFTKAYPPAKYGWMSITNKAGHSGAHSLTSDSNNTGIRKVFDVDQFIRDSIAGLEFYLMATKAGQTELYAAFGQGGNSAGMLPNGWQTVFGMGIDKHDSLWCMYEKYDNPQADSDLVHKTCGALGLNTWYKCNIEYDFTAMKLTYYLNNAPVYSRSAPNRTIEEFIVFRDTAGAQGPKDYFIDDVTIYKR